MPGPSSSSVMSKRPLLSARSILLFRHSAFAVVGPSFYLAPLSKGLGGLEISGSIALPDRIHRFIPLVANDSRHYFALKDDTETESLRGTGPFASLSPLFREVTIWAI